MRHDVLTRSARFAAMALVAGLAGLAVFAQEGATPPLPQATELPQATGLPQAACAALQGVSIPASAIGLPTQGALVQSAALVSATAEGNANGTYCKVTGIVKPQNPTSPNLEFEVNLPVAWNRRALQMGGGGYDGTLVTGLTGFTLQPATCRQPAEAGLRHARQRRRPQVRRRLRRLVRDG